MINPVYNDIKVYQINLDFYELDSFKLEYNKVILHIINYHKENFQTEYDLTHSIEYFTKDDNHYTLYTFNELEKESIWKDFFPKELVKDKDFLVKSTSFSLFIQVGTRLFCVIGGKGISVITRFLNQTFGLDFYEKIAEPENDVVHSHVSRSVSGNLTSEQRTFRNEQKLQDVLSIGRIPKKIYLMLRQELKDTLFDFINFDKSENIYLEISIAFCLKWKITFNQLHEMVIKINEVLDSSGTKSLSRFEKVIDENLINNNLLPALLNYLRDDMVSLSTPTIGISFKKLLDYDFVHPNKLTVFYECDEYKAYFKNAKEPFFETRDRTTIYSSVLKHIYSLVEPNEINKFNSIILGTRIRGFTGLNKKSEAMFINHLTCELDLLSTPYFLIDNHWYKVKGDFIESINEQCHQMIKRNLLLPNPLYKPWNNKLLSEGEYNLLYKNENNYLVLDKILGQNIELCDVLYETNESIYLIHVKDGFDAKIRDLTSQISISANRLWNDLKSDQVFLKEIFSNFVSSGNNTTNISWDDFLKKFKTKEIIYVLAFSTNLIGKTVLKDINSHKSNIAKFSIIQNFREVQVNNYQLKVIEIEKSI